MPNNKSYLPTNSIWLFQTLIWIVYLRLKLLNTFVNWPVLLLDNQLCLPFPNYDISLSTIEIINYTCQLANIILILANCIRLFHLRLAKNVCSILWQTTMVKTDLLLRTANFWWIYPTVIEKCNAILMLANRIRLFQPWVLKNMVKFCPMLWQTTLVNAYCDNYDEISLCPTKVT